MRRLIVRDNCHPAKASLVLWFQVPFWLIMSISLRSMVLPLPGVAPVSVHVKDQLSNEGILWFTDLTQADPYCLLPFITAVVNLAIVQVIGHYFRCISIHRQSFSFIQTKGSDREQRRDGTQPSLIAAALSL